MSEISKTAFISVNDIMVRLIHAAQEGDKDSVIRLADGLDEGVEAFVDSIYAQADVREEDMAAYAERQQTMVKLAACENPRALVPDLDKKPDIPGVMP